MNGMCLKCSRYLKTQFGGRQFYVAKGRKAVDRDSICRLRRRGEPIRAIAKKMEITERRVFQILAGAAQARMR